MQVTPIINVVGCNGVFEYMIDWMIVCSWLLWGIWIPKRYLNWLIPIIIAAADVNPLITGLDKKDTINPIRNIPISNCIAPIRNAKRMAIIIYWEISIIERAPKPVATNNESIATGPTDNCLDVPKKA